MSEDKRPEWMTSISATVDPEDYLLGRKIDKTFELSQKERAERAKELRISLASSDKLKFIGDPMLDIERRRQEMKLELIRNPIKLKQLREKLLKEEREKQGVSASQNQSEKRQSPIASSSSTLDKIRESHIASRRRSRSPSSRSKSNSVHYNKSSDRRHVDQRKTQDYKDRHSKEHPHEYPHKHQHDSGAPTRRERDTASSSYSRSSSNRHRNSSLSTPKNYSSRRRSRSRSPRRTRH